MLSSHTQAEQQGGSKAVLLWFAAVFVPEGTKQGKLTERLTGCGLRI